MSSDQPTSHQDQCRPPPQAQQTIMSPPLPSPTTCTCTLLYTSKSSQLLRRCPPAARVLGAASCSKVPAWQAKAGQRSASLTSEASPGSYSTLASCSVSDTAACRTPGTTASALSTLREHELRGGAGRGWGGVLGAALGRSGLLGRHDRTPHSTLAKQEQKVWRQGPRLARAGRKPDKGGGSKGAAPAGHAADAQPREPHGRWRRRRAAQLRLQPRALQAVRQGAGVGQGVPVIDHLSGTAGGVGGGGGERWHRRRAATAASHEQRG